MMLWSLLGTCTAVAQYTALPDTARYPWIQPSMCRIQFYQYDAIRPFYNAWKAADTSKCVIVHMGDSHVQPESHSEVPLDVRVVNLGTVT